MAEERLALAGHERRARPAALPQRLCPAAPRAPKAALKHRNVVIVTIVITVVVLPGRWHRAPLTRSGRAPWPVVGVKRLPGWLYHPSRARCPTARPQWSFGKRRVPRGPGHRGTVGGRSLTPVPLVRGTRGWEEGGKGGTAVRGGQGSGLTGGRTGPGWPCPAAAPKPAGAAGLTWAREMPESSLTAELLPLTPLTLALSLIVSRAQGAGPGRADRGGPRTTPCPGERGGGTLAQGGWGGPVPQHPRGRPRRPAAGPGTVRRGRAQPSMPRR